MLYRGPDNELLVDPLQFVQSNTTNGLPIWRQFAVDLEIGVSLYCSLRSGAYSALSQRRCDDAECVGSESNSERPETSLRDSWLDPHSSDCWVVSISDRLGPTMSVV